MTTGRVNRRIMGYTTQEGELVEVRYTCCRRERSGLYIGQHLNSEEVEGSELESVLKSKGRVPEDLGSLVILEGHISFNSYPFYGKFTEEDEFTLLQELQPCIEEKAPAAELDFKLRAVIEAFYPARENPFGTEGVDGGREYHTPEAAD